MTSNLKLNIRERFRIAVKAYQYIDSSSFRQILEEYQRLVANLLQELSFLQSIVDSLGLFSDNEELREINTPYLSFLAIPFYQSNLYMKLLADISQGDFRYNPSDILEHKVANLQIARGKLLIYLQNINRVGSILLKDQVAKLENLSDLLDSSLQMVSIVAIDPATRRAEKIANLRKERELQNRLIILDEYYSMSTKSSEEEDDPLELLDDEIVRQVYTDQLQYFSLLAFNQLEGIQLELEVLSKKSTFDRHRAARENNSLPEHPKDEYAYTTRLERDPTKPREINDILSKQGKILQPFVITNKQDLRKKVFGTGQVLPSMSVEEYLDYELANGKMLKDEHKTDALSDDEENSDQERETRDWDDWKDDNPKGSGNIKGNIG